MPILSISVQRSGRKGYVFRQEESNATKMTISAKFSPNRATVKRHLALNHMDYDNLTVSLHPCVTSLRRNVLHYTSKNIEFLQKKKTNPKQTKGNNANNLIETNV